MEDTQSVAVLLDSATSKIQQLQKAFAELESHTALSLNFKWQALEDHFHGLEKSLKRRFHELEDQEKEYENKTVEAEEIIEKRKADVVAKEQASLERLQEKRDAAVFAIATAREKHRRLSCEEYSVTTSESQGGTLDYTPTNSMISEVSSDYTSGTVDDGSPEVQSADNGNREATSYPELVKLCEDMNAEGLHSFISDNRKNLASMREEIPQALNASPDPACLVLDSLNNFYRGDVTNLDAKKDSSLLGPRRTCIMLMECLNTLFMSLDAASVSKIITADVKARAKAIAEAWKPKLIELDLEAGSGNSLEAHAYLQLLASFSIASDFDVEELTKLVPLVSRRRQAADLCRSLGLTDKMPGVIEVLINSGRQIDAINLAFQFELTEQFSPVPLLQSYLKEAKKVPSPVKAGNVSPSSSNAQNEVNQRELGALKAAIKCVEEHKLEQQFPVDTLSKRVLQLEKAKAEKKRATEVSKPQFKKPRATNAGYGCITNLAVNTHPGPYAARMTDNRYPPHQYVFDNRPYVYTAGPPTDNHCPAVLGAPAFGFPPPGHGNYYGNGFQYQGPYLH